MAKKTDNNKKILLTGGRGPAVLDLARQLHRAGHTVYMAESRSIYFCRFSNTIKAHAVIPHPAKDETGFIQGLVSLIEKYDIDYLIPGYDEGFFVAKHKNSFPSSTTVFVENAETIDILNNKFKFIEHMQKLGIGAPHSEHIKNEDELKQVFAAQKFEKPYILKSIYSAGGLMAKTIRENTQLEDIKINFPCIAQKMIPGRVWSTYSVVHQGRMTFFVNYYPLYTFRENGAAICFETQFSLPVFELVKKIVKEMNYTGQIGFDIIEHPDGSLWPIECNPRVTSGAHLAKTVENFADCLLNPDSPLRIPEDDKRVQLSRLSMLRILTMPLPTDFKTWTKHFLGAEDVLFDAKDIMPAVSMPLVGLLFFHQYLKYKKSAEENIFLNIDWGG